MKNRFIHGAGNPQAFIAPRILSLTRIFPDENQHCNINRNVTSMSQHDEYARNPAHASITPRYRDARTGEGEG